MAGLLRKSLCALALSLALVPAGNAATLVEPTLHLKPQGGGGRVALTLDACGGKTDTRILSALVDNRIPATIFVTGIWLKRNAAAVEIMRAHPDLFELENHGGRHIPAVDTPRKIYGISSAGSADAVQAEVESGAAALASSGGPAPRWFRGATAEYSPSAIATIRKLGFKIAGFSVNGDGGSLLGAKETARRIAAAKDGDVIIAHINQPTHSAGEGVVQGLLALKQKGMTFVRLDDAEDVGNDGTTD
ncbi:polysaccharide deacetylase [Mesorhizobium sp. M1C.F.Ca.ET.193.01.1.1]|uniref:polysaccharide deacetylase family protein n=1 Tax=unclassified Mesorhizobium TaxID=325217 RepID=UPI000FD44FA1|nr:MULTISPECIES: polysaccharide deacetylase family protein [unclassified Mesorhizobium]TGS94980.1 polysaccharide deacetylase [bacterium M00.F.Ca.ET.177.01.1.1]TGQ51322.1 polysaccharide deacetylase [Mesorhizobium sp. M1C.F.Ca.ET.210.01.1.1]TGQ67111.1 polysaccharide deacetylase [Mesorhizobium sp. M1C.F.Ca.ET.212.01.1.1]TGR01607.1 polysaccharide deacetylase [Mesorhizobium sp. M1C.F.Ca.ET.204.01.1.1]TGR22169.1 polysaccharide deacetylase [Mesorhizobium sp. M1C.F.Ca.ET.196.01.1.1]